MDVSVPNARALPLPGPGLALAPFIDLARASLDGVDFDTLVAAEGHGIASQQLAGGLCKQWLAVHWSRDVGALSPMRYCVMARPDPNWQPARAWLTGSLGSRWIFVGQGGPHILRIVRFVHSFLALHRPDSEFAGFYAAATSPRVFTPDECRRLGWTAPLPPEEVERHFDGQRSFA